MTTPTNPTQDELKEQLRQIVKNTRREAVWFEKNKYTRTPVGHDIGTVAERAVEELEDLIEAHTKKTVREAQAALLDELEDHMGRNEYDTEDWIEMKRSELTKKGE